MLEYTVKYNGKIHIVILLNGDWFDVSRGYNTLFISDKNFIKACEDTHKNYGKGK